MNLKGLLVDNMPPAIAVYKIANGYLIRKEEDGRIFYCKDEREIADHIITGAVRERISKDKSIPEQLELFPEISLTRSL
jgi:hypothetical protein